MATDATEENVDESTGKNLAREFESDVSRLCERRILCSFRFSPRDKWLAGVDVELPAQAGETANVGYFRIRPKKGDLAITTYSRLLSDDLMSSLHHGESRPDSMRGRGGVKWFLKSSDSEGWKEAVRFFAMAARRLS